MKNLSYFLILEVLMLMTSCTNSDVVSNKLNVGEKNCYYVSISGSDSNAGTIDAPFATLSKAQSLVQPGDTVYIRKGVYKVAENQVMENDSNSIWDYVFNMNKSGTIDKNIYYSGYKNERPVFDLSTVKPENKRVIVFYVSGSYLHFKNIEVTGTQVTILTHTQSECFHNEGGNNNIYENLSMHDGMAIGFYLTKGMNNLILNCDAYNNYDPVSEGGAGGNVDGFGCHPNSAGSTGNVFRGCRAWYNSDDGFDLINSYAATTFDHCWSFLNGYKTDGSLAADGNGFKAGGYGMTAGTKIPSVIPSHTVRFCLAYGNKSNGFYSNHHLNGDTWLNNTAYKNSTNFNMVNRKSATEIVDVDGYNHVLTNNLSFSPKKTGEDIMNIDLSKCTVNNNTFLPNQMTVTSDDFVGLDASQLTRSRKTDGSLPDIDFMVLKENNSLYKASIGYSVTDK